MNKKAKWNRGAQITAVLFCALLLKLGYSTASADQLKWILAPTTFLVEFVSGTQFAFESRAGYLSSDRSFLIGVSCAGVNFLLTSFLMLSLRKLWRDRTVSIAWWFLPINAALAYMTTIVANTARISTALWLRRSPLEIDFLNPNQLHRFEGIVIYFGFLLLLFIVSEQLSSNGTTALVRQCFFPLLVYYATMLGMPLANGAYRQGAEFWEHAAFVLLVPLLLIVPVALARVVHPKLSH